MSEREYDERECFGDFPVEELSEIDFILEGKVNRCTAKQRQYIHAMLDEIGMEESEALDDIGKGFLAKDFESPLREMTLEEAGTMIDMLQPLFYESKNGNKYSSNKNNNNQHLGGWF